jgi:hypothetical protein
VQAVGELDQHDPHILGHRQDHLPQVLGLRGPVALLAGGGRLVGLGHLAGGVAELRDAIHEARDLRAEFSLQVIERTPGVLDHIVEQGGGERLGVDELDLDQGAGGGDRVVNVRFAALAKLPGVGGRREIVGALQHRRVSIGELRLHEREQILELRTPSVRLGEIGR